jgi:hypothetical protein
VFIKPIPSDVNQVHLLRTGSEEPPPPQQLIRRPDGPSHQETTMKNLILAAIATLSLGLGIANAQSLSHSAPNQNSTAAWSNFAGAVGN